MSADGTPTTKTSFKTRWRRHRSRRRSGGEAGGGVVAGVWEEKENWTGRSRLGQVVTLWPLLATVFSVSQKYISLMGVVDLMVCTTRIGCLYSMTFQDDSAIITHYLVLARDPIIPRADKPFKTSIVFTLQEGPGVLFKALVVFALRGSGASLVYGFMDHLWDSNITEDTAEFLTTMALFSQINAQGVRWNNHLDSGISLSELELTCSQREGAEASVKD
ncbi:hypothetical protein C3L33_00819, partial [Rhododendron williamsianum]